MPFTQLRHGRLYYEIEGKGPPLVLISGFTCDRTFWDLIRHDLAKHFSLLLPDNRCSGQSESSEASITIEEMADDISEMIDRLQLHRPFVLGHSMGGAIVQALAYRHPTKIAAAIISHSLVKVHPITATVLELHTWLVKEQTSIRTRTKAMMPWLCSNEFLSDARNCEAFISANEKSPFPMTTHNLEKQFEAISKFNPNPWLEQITIPSFIFCGEEDLLCPLKDSQMLAKKIPNATLHIFAKQAHLTPMETPQIYGRAIIDTLLQGM